jgi:Mg-chelatase subunit ChlD
MAAFRRFLVIAAVVALAVPTAFADTRKGNIDVVIALDKSLSMESKIGAVKEWVTNSIVDQLLIPGDSLVIVTFYGKAEVLVSTDIAAEADKAAVRTAIAGISGNGHFTDIGNALDAVKAEIAKRESDGRDKYVLLLTDGIQEAPPGSKYYTKDGSFNHEFLANTKTIPEKGWKVMILGLGTGTAAKDLAGELQGSYAEVPADASAGAIASSAGAVFSTTVLTEPLRLDGIGRDGRSRITLSLRTSGLPGDATIVVSGVSARIGSRDVPAILSTPVTIVAKHGAVTVAGFGVTFPAELPQGAQWGTLSFTFASSASFVPAATSTLFTVNGWLQNNRIYLEGGAALVVVLAALALFLAWKATRGKPVRFALSVNKETVGDDPAALSGRHALFLDERAGAFTLAARRTPKSLARFFADDGRLSLEVLRKDRFPKLPELPPDVRGHSFSIKTENGRTLPLKVVSRERK